MQDPQELLGWWNAVSVRDAQLGISSASKQCVDALGGPKGSAAIIAYATIATIMQNTSFSPNPILSE